MTIDVDKEKAHQISKSKLINIIQEENTNSNVKKEEKTLKKPKMINKLVPPIS